MLELAWALAGLLVALLYGGFLVAVIRWGRERAAHGSTAAHLERARYMLDQHLRMEAALQVGRARALGVLWPQLRIHSAEDAEAVAVLRVDAPDLGEPPRATPPVAVLAAVLAHHDELRAEK